VLIVAGAAALMAPLLTTLTTVVFYGWLLVVGGASETVAALSARPWGGFVLPLLGGILAIVVGVSLVGHPGAAAQGLTLLVSTFFLFGGLMRAAVAASVRFPSWGWSVAGGLVTASLGAIVWSEWPASSSWLIGTYFGVEMLTRGWALLMLALAVRSSTAT
jgi:uncharacterized membrane protein HdeD (DUF308 family)